jgi:hypothetical protein
MPTLTLSASNLTSLEGILCRYQMGRQQAVREFVVLTCGSRSAQLVVPVAIRSYHSVWTTASP